MFPEISDSLQQTGSLVPRLLPRVARLSPAKSLVWLPETTRSLGTRG